MMSHPKRIFWIAILVAWCFDFLFWKKTMGVSFFVFVTIALGTGFYLSWRENIQPDKRSLWLLIPVLGFAALTIIRREPFTTFTNILLTLLSMSVFAHAYIDGRWLKYSWSDYIAAFYSLFVSIFAKPVEALTRARQRDSENSADKDSQSKWKLSLPYLRGLLIAAPILVVFASLFAAADPIFSDYYLGRFVEIFRLEILPEYIFRGVYILILGYALAGVYLHAFANRKDKPLIGEEKPWLPTFLGFTESTIVLGSVNLLFLLFVAVQFRYFFGGQSNIRLDGFTYAEYARSGFAELVVVSFFSLLLFLGLSTVSRRENKLQRKAFSAMGAGLFLLVVVILVSAFQRLLLYEQAYGFTRLRIYSHLFMAWLGVLLAAAVLLELFRRQRAFALAGFLVAIGFVFSLNLVDVDRLIVNRNVQRAITDADLSIDAAYLFSLSSDATPALINAQQHPQLSEFEKNEVAAVLACQAVELAAKRQGQSWQSFHLSEGRAWNLLAAHRDDYRSAQVYKQGNSWWVMVNGEYHPCHSGAFGLD